MKRLKVAFTPHNGGYNMKIVEQTHRYLEFGHNDYTWQASNGLRLISITSPIADFKKAANRLWVRGNQIQHDESVIYINSLKEIEHVKQAVAEYNRVFNNQTKVMTNTTTPAIEVSQPDITVPDNKKVVVVDSTTDYIFYFSGYTVKVGPDGVTVKK